MPVAPPHRILRPPIGSIAVYTNNIGKHNTPIASLEVTLSKGGCGSLPRQPRERVFSFSLVDTLKLNT